MFGNTFILKARDPQGKQISQGKRHWWSAAFIKESQCLPTHMRGRQSFGRDGWRSLTDALKESRVITDTRRFCTEKLSEGSEREEGDLVIFVTSVLSSSGWWGKLRGTREIRCGVGLRQEREPVFLLNHRTQWMTIAREALGLIEILLLLFHEKYCRPPTSTEAASLRGSTTWSRITRVLIITRSLMNAAAYSGWEPTSWTGTDRVTDIQRQQSQFVVLFSPAVRSLSEITCTTKTAWKAFIQLRRYKTF